MITDVQSTISNFFEELKTQLYMDNKFEEADAIETMSLELLRKIDIKSIEELCRDSYNDGYRDCNTGAFDDGHDEGWDEGYNARKNEE